MMVHAWTETCRNNYILITNLMYWLLFIHKILFSSVCFKPKVHIFRRIQLYTCSIWYCHSLREFMVATTNSHREWQYHMLHVYNCILLRMRTLGSKHVVEDNILWLNNNQCIKFVITRVGTLIVATIYLQLIQNRYMFRSFTVLQYSHQHCVQPVASDVEVVGYL